MKDSLEQARKLCAEGYLPIPVGRRDKKPVLPNWQHAEITTNTVDQYFNGYDTNIGVVLGKGIIDIDLDDPVAIQLAPHFLPKSGKIFGRPSKQRSHYLYKSSHQKTKQFKYKQQTLLELRGQGAQTVVPPSTHTSGEDIRWEVNDEWTEVSTHTIAAAAAKLALATLFTKEYPTSPGSRDEICLALSGALLRAKWSTETTDQFVYRIARTAKDEEAESRKKGLRVKEQLSQDKHAWGFPRFCKLMDFDASTKTLVASWMGLKTEEDIAEQEVEPLKVFEYRSTDSVQSRPWVIPGLLMKKTATLLVGPPGAGKTSMGALMMYSLATGKPFLGKEVLETGNCLIIAAEESKNEIKLKFKAIEQVYGDVFNQKIYYRGLEDDLKLVQFDKNRGTTPTKGYHALAKQIELLRIKHLYLDPLINFKTGGFDENDNEQMEQYIKNFLIPLAVNNELTLSFGHHANKISGISFNDKYDDKPEIDNVNAMYAARGASSLVAAARFVLTLYPMTKYLWETYYANICEGPRNRYVGLVEAKSNYSDLSDNINWLDKKIVNVTTADHVEEQVAVLVVSNLNEVTNQRSKLHFERNKEQVLKRVNHIIDCMGGGTERPINQVAEQLVLKEPDYQNGEIKKQTIKSRIVRLLEAGLQEGLEFDGFVYRFEYRAYESKTKKWIIKTTKTEEDNIPF